MSPDLLNKWIERECDKTKLDFKKIAEDDYMVKWGDDNKRNERTTHDIANKAFRDLRTLVAHENVGVNR